MRPNLWIKIFAPGIGDLVCLLPILKNLKLNYVNNLNILVFNQAQKDLLSRSPYIDKAVICTENPRSLIPKGEFYIDIAETDMEKNYYWGSEDFINTFGKMHIYEVLSKAIQVSGDFKNIEPLKANRDIKYSNTVLLGIGGRRGNKLWFNDYWLELYSLLTEYGYSVGMVGARGHNGSGQIAELEKEGIPFIETDNLAECIDVITNSAGMISIDSGIMHLSAMQQIPTVSLFGPMPAWLWGPKASHVYNIDGGCGINCSMAPLDWECVGRPCMRSITPKMVMIQLLKLKGKM